ncbi:hypothetical protein R3P38DRAFT_1660150 [Favolaschia claudopus]|uniref:Uncharacterized protein n=1 Tax=Favolaschia claudopus TaxID=2862362 RepID=A0AAW0AEK2_9AGAR
MVSPSCTQSSAYLADVLKPSADPLINTCLFEAKGELLGLRHCQAATQPLALHHTFVRFFWLTLWLSQVRLICLPNIMQIDSGRHINAHPPLMLVPGDTLQLPWSPLVSVRSLEGSMSMTPTEEVLGRRNGTSMHRLRRRPYISLIDRTSQSSPGYTPKIMADGNSRQHAHDRAAGASHYISSRKRHIRLETLRGVGAARRSQLVPPLFPLPIRNSRITRPILRFHSFSMRHAH